MNPRQARRERREAERKAKKLELKKSRLASTDAPEPIRPNGFVSQTLPEHAAPSEFVRQNATQSTTKPSPQLGKQAA